MQRKLYFMVNRYARQNHRRYNWGKFVRFLACIVVFATTYALILPAITMEKPVCEIEEHVHSETCYQKVVQEPETSIVCTYESLGVHIHSEDCYDGDGNLQCGKADFLVHVHDASCVDASGTLLCQLPEIAEHIHTAECYEAVMPATEENHVHEDSCYTMIRGELTCQLAETEGHTHGAECYTRGELLCGLEEQEGHSHDNGCYEAVQICELAEEEAHIHADGCYEQIPVLDCVPEPTQVLICTEPVAERHIHNESCFVTEPIPEEALTCTLPEDETHTHSDRCYGTWELICGKDEHTHSLRCQSDPKADVENEAIWTAAFADTTLSGNWREDVLTIARSQLGYEESKRNYIVLEDGETIKGYTRYGAWYGIPYGDWCAMFASFCLHYAGVEDMPINASCRNWIEVLTELELYHPAEAYTPQSGDLIFFDWDGNTIAEHVGIVAEMIPATEEEAAKVKTIEGNTFRDDVSYREYYLNDVDILGYSELPEAEPEYEGICHKEEHTHDETCLDENGQLICGLEEHTHSVICMDPEAELYCWLTEHVHTDACVDEEGNALCQLDEHTHVPDCYDAVLSLVVMIDTLPTSEEAEEILLAYEEKEDWEGYAAYQQKVSELAWRLYYACEELSENKLALVTNYDRLMDLQWLWSATTYPAPGKSPYYPMENGEWLTDVPEDNDFYKYIHVNEVVPDAYTVDGLVLGAKLTDRCEPSFTPVFTESLAGLTNAECKALTGYAWSTMDSAGLDNTYGANLILPADDAGHDAITEGKKTFVVYYNIGTYKGDQIDLIVQIVNYKPFEDTKGVVHDGILGFYSNGYIGVAVCGVEWVKLQYSFIEHKDIEAAVARAENGESLTGLRRTVKGSTSFFDIDYSQAVHIHGSDATSWDEMLTGIYVTNVPSKDPEKQPDVPDLSYVDSLTGNTAKRDYFRNWPADDCLLKVGTVDHAYSSWTGPAIYSSHPYDDANEDWRTDSKHGFTATFDHTWFNINFSFNKGRNADGGIRHFGEPVSRGSLTITKDVEGVNIEPEKEYEFRITFHKKKSDGTYTPDTSLDGTYGGVTFTNGVGTFTLKDGGSVTVNNIPIRQNGTHYRVEELNHDGYVVKTSMSSQARGDLTTDGPYTADYYENAIQADSLMVQKQTVTFTNRRNSIFVSKELTANTDVEMVGDPDFSFQIMKADANGNKTGTPFFGAGVEYTIYDNATNAQIDTGTTEEDGIFKLKAGQRAEFSGLSEDAGNYYVREILSKTFAGQYANIYVNGQLVTGREDVYIPVDEITYTGVSSSVQNSQTGDNGFDFNNQVNSEKLSYLTITKMVEGVSDDVEKTLEFDMKVELNGTLNGTEGWTPIPVGTPYTLYRTDLFMSNGQKVKIENNPDRVVTTEGIVTVPGGATAEIDYMIPGTTWRVYETSGSAEGYTVVYKEFWGTEPWIKAYADRVEGTIPVYNESNLATAHVCMTVTNTLPATKVEFSVYKKMANGNLDTNAHTVNFTAKCITATAKDGSSVAALLGTGTQSKVTISNNQWNAVNFLIGYDYYSQFDGHVATNNWPVRLIYEIVEVPSTDNAYTHDPTKYYVAVDVNLTRVWGSWNFTATLVTPVPVHANNAVPESGYATYTNYLLGDLTLEKVVNGGIVSQENGRFNFTVQLGTDATTALQNWNVQVVKNGESAGTLTTDSSGSITLTDIKHGDKVELRGIPLGTVWRITETNADGYSVSWTKTDGSGSGNSATGSIPTGGMDVVFTNTVSYELLQTGGMGTTLFYIFGAILMLGAAVLLVTKKRMATAE